MRIGVGTPSKGRPLEQSTFSVYKKRVLQNLKHVCPYCSTENGGKMYRIYFSGSRKEWLHGYCIREIGGMPKTIAWLDKNMPFYFEKNKEDFTLPKMEQIIKHPKVLVRQSTPKHELGEKTNFPPVLKKTQTGDDMK